MTGDSLDGVVDRSTTCLLVEECTGHRPSSHRDEGNASFVRACDLAVAVSQANPVLLLSLEKTHLNARDLDLLCRMLTRTTCSVKYLKLGRGEDDDETPGLSDECLRLFFQSLPGMESLEDLTLHQVAPSSMSETILGGIRRNYSLHRVTGLTFDADAQGSTETDLEIAAIVRANAHGRRTVFLSVKGQLPVVAAVGEIHRLANSADPEDDTTLFLCLQLFIPSLHV
jgi:hypothetical protein